MIDFCIFGINHVSAPVDVREKFAFGQDLQLEVLEKLADAVEEVVLVSTCNRTEVIYREKDAGSQDRIREVLCAGGNVRQEALDQYFYSYSGRPALVHLFRVASGLDSMVLGETQILGQTKNAFELSFKNGYSKGCFHQIYQRMLNAAKAVRSETGVTKGSVSISSMAVQLAKNIFDSLDDKTIALIGAGEMCELAAENFKKSRVRDIHVINRNLTKAVRLAERFSGSAHVLDELPQVIAGTDIILSSVASDEPILSYENVREVMQRRKRLLFIIDIAVPRNVDARVNRLPDVYLYNIDDLQQLISDNMKERHKEGALAEKLIQKKIDGLLSLNGKLAGELILSLQERATNIKNKELERLFHRHRNFSDEDKQRVEQSVNLIINKILHDPIISLRRGLHNGKTSDNYVMRRFKDFFNL